MATSKTQADSEESRVIDHDSYIGMKGRDRVLFTMSTIRTICALLGALAQAIVLYKIYHLGH